VELERPLGREVVVQGPQGGGRPLDQEVLGFRGICEAAILFRQEASGHKSVEEEPQAARAHPQGVGELRRGPRPAL
jgi:hypothetical protein